MNMPVLRTIAKLCLPFVKLLCSVFYDKQYLVGKYFDESFSGWQWALKGILWQKIFGFNRHIPWPASPFININSKKNIVFDINDINNFQTMGCYFQNFSAKIVIGKGTYIAQNVGIITANHDPQNPDDHLPGKDVTLGKQCWIGMNSMILPGVVLGDHTVVGAGSVVTKSFPEGHVIIGGNPAKIIRHLEISREQNSNIHEDNA